MLRWCICQCQQLSGAETDHDEDHRARGQISLRQVCQMRRRQFAGNSWENDWHASWIMNCWIWFATWHRLPYCSWAGRQLWQRSVLLTNQRAGFMRFLDHWPMRDEDCERELWDNRSGHVSGREQLLKECQEWRNFTPGCFLLNNCLKLQFSIANKNYSFYW